ncbi:MAG: cytochrome P450 [Burkholderiaceae bacterium]|nr:cytochrome P450 [Pseudomonadota bacterium]MCO5117579.1 cytochrome P450 [Burkholderiaceae bacterium]MCP5218259.1 cytochrome P450 [Burkholderiaceae bacterium]
MTSTPPPDWDPQAPDVLADPRAAYDALRERCPVAFGPAGQATVTRHADVLRVLLDPATFSSAVSAHPAVPNGYDAPRHTAYRRALDPFFAPERTRHFSPVCRRLAVRTVQEALSLGSIEAGNEFALPFAVRVQSAFLGWPALIQDELIDWLHRSHAATRSGDRALTAQVAQEFEAFVERVRDARLGAAPTQDISTELMHTQVDGRPLNLRELASVLRNWTVGEVGTIAASVGILLHWLATEPDWQQRLRAEPALLPAAIDEVLRRDGPLPANRRITTRAVELGGRSLPAGTRLSLSWIAANRDPRALAEPDRLHLDRDPALNLLYGAGIHVCPGAPLARLELRLLMEELLIRTQSIALAAGHAPTRAAPPDAGYASLRIRLR